MKTSTPEEINKHLREVRHRLTCYRLSLQEMADVAGIAKQTLSQSCMLPSTRGSRTISAAALDRLRTAAIETWVANTEHGFPLWLGRDKNLWLVFSSNLELVLETTSPWRAEWHAARIAGSVLPGPENTRKDDLYMAESDDLCVAWVECYHSGLVTPEEAMDIAGVDEYLIERVGIEHPGWRILPTPTQVKRMQELVQERRQSYAA